MSAFREQPLPGPAFVLREASKRGYTGGDPSWCNLGQGQPQLGPIPGAPDRPAMLRLEDSDYAYGPVGGTHAMRQAIADHYNRLYRCGLRSQYSAENVAVSAGGRLALSRILSALGTVVLRNYPIRPVPGVVHTNGSSRRERVLVVQSAEYRR